MHHTKIAEKGNRTITGYTWHHNADSNNMQLIPKEVHEAVKHIGQGSLSKGK
ncbi:HNH endonuclease [Aliarcobacter butzleri]|uniref:HNH endonuclease n=1 Tax=Aliarcobacter butzleri TaxID=28197 RepID=UPI0039BE4DE6